MPANEQIYTVVVSNTTANIASTEFIGAISTGNALERRSHC